MANATELLHDRSRLAIVSMLGSSPTGAAAFTEIRERTGLTAGNLSSHLRTMENAGLVSITKEFQGRRPLTTVELTEAGRRALEEFIREMEEIIHQFRRGS